MNLPLRVSQLNEQRPLVSICCLTYNHGHFIKEALDGFLMQEAEFSVEIIIHDDCSTDDTADIIRTHHDRFPDLISPIYQTENQYSKGTKILPIVLSKARGRYVALCEGDDYWTDPLKLQKQVELLEANPEYSLCFHNATLIYQDGSQEMKPKCPPEQKRVISIEDVLMSNPIPTASVLFRNGLISEYPTAFHRLIMLDWPTWVLLAEHGDFLYINETMSVYRIHSGGVWSGGNYRKQLRGWFDAYDVVDDHLSNAYQKIITEAKIIYLWTAVDMYLEEEASSDSQQHSDRKVKTFLEQYIGQDRVLVKRFLREYHARRFFLAAESGDYRTIRRSVPKLLLHNPALIANRGVLSNSVRAWLSHGLEPG